MPFNAEAIKPTHDQITEMQRKIKLLEGDKSAYYESAQSTIKKNKDSIIQLRQDNKRLHRKLAETSAGDEHVIKQAFHNRGSEKDAYRNMSGKTALAALEHGVLIKKKRLDAMRHATKTRRQRLEELQLQYEKLKPVGSKGALSADAHTHKREEAAMKLRMLENSLEKAQFKCQEAEHITSCYLKLKNHLQVESLGYPGQLDHLEAEILKHREELRSLKVMNNDAQLSKDTAKTELQQQEELLYKERKERERVMSRYRKQVEERKAQTEKHDRRVQRAPMQPDELGSEAQRSTTRLLGEEDKTISTFEEAFRRIKEATGVSDIRDIVERFISQGETHRHLEGMKVEKEGVLVQLKEEKERLHHQFQVMKFSGETQLSSRQQMLEECEQHLQAEQERCDAAKEHLDWLLRTLSTVGAGVDHLAEKLQHISLAEGTGAQLPQAEGTGAQLPQAEGTGAQLPLAEGTGAQLPQAEGTGAQLSPDCGELVVELLSQCELKLQLLHKELEGKDQAAIMKEMEDEEFISRIMGKLPDCNTRIKLPEDQKLDPFDDDEDSEEDEADIISREALKCQSQLILDSKTKKKPRKR